MRLDLFLARLPDVASRTAAERLLAGGVLVDGERRTKSFRLRGGEEVELPAAAPAAAPEPVPELHVVYEDQHLLVVARSQEAHERLQTLVRRRKLERGYLALVRGRPRSRRGRIEAPIGRDRRDPTRISIDTERPKEAVTHFEVEQLLERHTLLRVRLETGRMHQIRVHLAAIGLPVVGDRVYGVSEPALGRQFLHAATLAFPHPLTGERVEAESPLPPDLQAFLDGLR